MPVLLNPLPDDERLAATPPPALGTPLSPAEAQRLALAVALRGLGRVAPNPLVGSVLVDRDHRFVAVGAHERIGDLHAEASALAVAERSASDLIAGGTLYVTLEPCAHQGRQPACAPRVAASRVARVVYGVQDPNPQVDGKGAAILAAAGIPSAGDPAWRAACEDLAEVYLHAHTHKRPFVALKAASSLDGGIGRAGDERAFLTGARARQYGHYLRVRYDAIMIGRKTLMADDPDLTPRDALVAKRTPRRIVVDPSGAGALHATKHGAKLLKHEPASVLWLIAEDSTDAAKALDGAGISYRPLKGAGPFAASSILTVLASEGLTSVLLEGGAGLYAAFLRENLVDRLHLFQAPCLLGDAGIIPLASGPARARGPVRITPLGDDWVLEARMGNPDVRPS